MADKKPSLDVCIDIAMGWKQLDFPPSDDRGWRLLGEALRRVSATEEHARRIRDEWAFEQSRVCPKPIELTEFAFNIPANPEQGRNLPEPCPLCLPYKGLWRLVQIGDNEGVERCTCARGIKLAAMDAAAKRPKSAKKKQPAVVQKALPAPRDTAMAAANDDTGAEDLF